MCLQFGRGMQELDTRDSDGRRADNPPLLLNCEELLFTGAEEG